MTRSRAQLVGALTMLLSIGASPEVLATVVVRTYVPDPLAVADSASACVLAVCTRSNRLDAPAHFKVIRRLGGVLPDSFTAYPRTDGYRENLFQAGWHYALVVRPVAPPGGPELRRIFRWRPAADFEIWHHDTADAPQPTGFPDSLAARLYASIWSVGRLPRSAAAETIAVWQGSKGPARSWGFAAVQNHPDLLSGGAVRRHYLAELEHADGSYRENLATRLSRYPDSASRALMARFARGDGTKLAAAVWLGAHDSTSWVRQLIVAIADRTLAEAPSPAPERLDLRDPDITRWTVILGRLRALVSALQPVRSAAEREALIRIARWAPLWHGTRYWALRSLAHDSTAVVRALLWETVETIPRFSFVDGPTPRDVTPFWTTEELYRALRDTSSVLRTHAYLEVGRRQDRSGADTLLAWLRANRVPGREDIPLEEATLMIEVLGDAGHVAALEDLLEWGRVPEDHVQSAVMEALAKLGDRRAAPYFRQLAKVPCTNIEPFTMRRLIRGISAVGDASDVAQLERWTVECPDVRDDALEGVGMLGGVPRMVSLIWSLERGSIAPERARDYELIEARVRERTRTGPLNLN